MKKTLMNDVYAILQKNYGELGGLTKSAKEITENIYAFIFWLELGNGCTFYPEPEIGKPLMFYNSEDHTMYDLNEVYEYWSNNKKQDLRFKKDPDEFFQK